MTARALWGHAVDALFPPRCLLCDEVLGLLPECPACKGELARLSRGHAPGIAAAPLVLDGAFAGDIPFVSSEGGDMCYNPDVAEALGVTIPEADLARGIDVTQQ